MSFEPINPGYEHPTGRRRTGQQYVEVTVAGAPGGWRFKTGRFVCNALHYGRVTASARRTHAAR